MKRECIHTGQSIIAGCSLDGGAALEEAAVKSAQWVRAKELESRALARKDPRAYKKALVFGQFFLIAVCCLIISNNAVITARELKPPPNIRIGTFATNETAEACIENLWIVSKGIQENKGNPIGSLICPSSGESYVLTNKPDGLVASCPNPSEHNLSAIFVSLAQPIVEVKK